MTRVFVYGSLRKGESNHTRFDGFGDRLVATGTVAGALLKDLGPYPAAVPSSSDHDRIVGEVYEIPDDIAATLDQFERGENFEGQPVSVVDASGAEIEALAYFPADPARFASYVTVEGGDWAKHRRARPRS